MCVRSYRQQCGIAGALDIVGDRWALLIVRELLSGPHARFTELQGGLPGIAPNLLTKRLRELEAHGVVQRDVAQGPGRVTTYRLTKRGRELDGLVRELLRWGTDKAPPVPPGSSFQMHWLTLPARDRMRDNRPDAPRVTVRFGSLVDGFEVVADGEIRVGPCDADSTPDATVTGPGQPVTALIQGDLSADDAAAAGVSVTGDTDALLRILPTCAANDHFSR
ncbi:MAG: winged helix-turn-helix transcriptional regulator [Pseudoclavibacter sp.]